MEQNLNVIHITTIDEGGAYKAVCRLHNSLLRNKIQSVILLRSKHSRNSLGNSCFNSVLSRFISKLKNGMNLMTKRGTIYRDLFGTDISQNLEVKNADIIMLHWINSFLSLRDIKKLAELNKPIVWVLHDMWPMTGGCHCTLECEGFKKTCGNCHLTSQNKKDDASSKNWRDKNMLFKSISPIFVGPSQWVIDEARKSSLLCDKRMIFIPHGIDTNIFKPLKNIDAIKEKYHIPKAKKIISFGAAFDGMHNPLKGFKFLLQALNDINRENVLVLLFGNTSEEMLKSIKQKYIEVGYISKETDMAEIYNISDVYVTPSLQETFGFTVCEALACGTPVVGFSVGGIAEQISHLQNGYLVPPKDIVELTNGINYCIEHVNEMKENIRNNPQDYSLERMGERYMNLFHTIINSKEKI